MIVGGRLAGLAGRPDRPDRGVSVTVTRPRLAARRVAWNAEDSSSAAAAAEASGDGRRTAAIGPAAAACRTGKAYLIRGKLTSGSVASMAWSRALWWLSAVRG